MRKGVKNIGSDYVVDGYGMMKVNEILYLIFKKYNAETATNIVYIAFRGSVYLLINFIDTNFELKKYKSDDIMVFRGIDDMYNNMSTETFANSAITNIKNYIINEIKSTVNVSGHSLGAGFACLLAYDVISTLLSNPDSETDLLFIKDNLYLICFEPLQIGNINLLNFLKTYITNRISIRKYEDIIPITSPDAIYNNNSLIFSNLLEDINPENDFCTTLKDRQIVIKTNTLNIYTAELNFLTSEFYTGVGNLRPNHQLLGLKNYSDEISQKLNLLYPSS